VRNTACPHVYSLEAIRELVRHGRGMIACPVAGCGEQVSMGSVKEDKGMARRVRVERERILEEGRVEREGEEVGEESMVVDENVKVE
jgi:SUMO ligase MMS21 Smc5/6 complex component